MKSALQRRGTPAVYFRSEIEKAEAEGLAPTDLRLRLTLGDAGRLKRDASVAQADISFDAGVMRFLGVEVEQGGVADSVLERRSDD